MTTDSVQVLISELRQNNELIDRLQADKSLPPHLANLIARHRGQREPYPVRSPIETTTTATEQPVAGFNLTGK